MSTRTELAPWPVNPAAALVAARTWLATVHLASNMVFGLAGFVVVLLGLVLSVGLLPLALIGVLVFGATVGFVRGFSRFERRRFQLLLDVDIPDPPPTDPSGRRLARALQVVRSPLTWRQIGYCLFRLPLGVLTCALVLAAWVLVLPGPYVARGLAALDSAVARAMLGPYTRAELAGRVAVLERSRGLVVDAAEAERRRIERDLHDGAQQRLVSLAMTLGRAQARYDSDPETARALLVQSHSEAMQVLTELRELTRGIHPPVLTDRGLDAALSGLAGRCPVPVAVEVDVEPRPVATVEAIAYFVVAEALTNVAKHACARCASVTVRRDGETLSVVVLDDGVGGADPAGGTGLAGMSDRVAGVDGRVLLDSPPGGPTVLTVELPCEL